MRPGEVVFGFGLDTGTNALGTLLAHAEKADRAGLDLVTVMDHPYLAQQLDAYAVLGVVLGRTTRVSGVVNVTNLPSRPAPMLARTVTALSALSVGRVVLGIGAGGLWPQIVKLGVQPLSPGQAVRAMAEAIEVVRALCDGGPPVTYTGEFYQVCDLVPAAVPAPRIWTGSVGPRSLEVTGRLADGWVPGQAADWRSERFRWSRPIIDAAATAAGRDPAAVATVATVYNLPGRITDKPLRVTRDDDGRWLGGSVDQWVEELTTAVTEHAAAGFVLFPAEDGTPVSAALARWAQEVVPAVRAAVAAPVAGP